jgi:hypothetical protein
VWRYLLQAAGGLAVSRPDDRARESFVEGCPIDEEGVTRPAAGPPDAVKRPGHQSFRPIRPDNVGLGVLLGAVRYRQDWMKASRSALIVSA